MEISKVKRLKNTIVILCFAFIVSVIYYTSTQILLYSDDYMYGTFFRNGIIDFFQRNIWHYNIFNGRIFIHILAQITLIFDTLLFPFVNLSFLFLICFYSYKSQNNDKTDLNFIIYTVFFLASVMILDIKMLRESLLWISGTFNYTLGAALIFALFYMQKKYIQTDKTDKNKFKWYIPVLSFICGATTEQYGFTAICVICIIGIICFAKKRFKLKNQLLTFIPCVMGWLTIILSPSTFKRFEDENRFELSEFFESVSLRFNKLSDMMSKNGSTILFVLFGILIAFAFLNDLKKNKKKTDIIKFSVGIIYSVLIFILSFFDTAAFSFCLNICFLIYSVIILFKHEEYIFTAISILAGLSSLFIMIMTNTMEYRILFPFCLFFISSCTHLFVVNIKKYKIAVALIPVYAVVCCIVFFPVVKGYHENKIIMDDNIKILKNSKPDEIIEFNTNFNDIYRHKIMYDNGYCYDNFCKYYNIDKNMKIYMNGGENQSYNKHTAEMIIDGNFFLFDAYTIAGSNYFKLDDIAFALNGTSKQFDVEWNFRRDMAVITSGIPYTEKENSVDNNNDSERTPVLIRSECKIYFNDEEVNFMAYSIDNENYFKLRDIGRAVDFSIEWNNEDKIIIIDTKKVYSDDD